MLTTPGTRHTISTTGNPRSGPKSPRKALPMLSKEIQPGPRIEGKLSWTARAAKQQPTPHRGKKTMSIEGPFSTDSTAHKEASVPAAHAQRETSDPFEGGAGMMTPGYLMGELAEGAKDGILGLLGTGLLYASIIVAWVLPIGGLAAGGFFLWRAIHTEGSKFFPLLVVGMSVATWIMSKSPLGLLPLLLELWA